jgi:hypothetical protein
MISTAWMPDLYFSVSIVILIGTFRISLLGLGSLSPRDKIIQSDNGWETNQSSIALDFFRIS